MNDVHDENARRDDRFPLNAEIEYFLDADILRASAIDISQTGVSFESRDSFIIAMRIRLEGRMEERLARLVYVSPSPDGTSRFGLEFLEDETPRGPKIP